MKAKLVIPYSTIVALTIVKNAKASDLIPKVPEFPKKPFIKKLSEQITDRINEIFGNKETIKLSEFTPEYRLEINKKLKDMLYWSHNQRTNLMGQESMDGMIMKKLKKMKNEPEIETDEEDSNSALSFENVINEDYSKFDDNNNDNVNMSTAQEKVQKLKELRSKFYNAKVTGIYQMAAGIPTISGALNGNCMGSICAGGPGLRFDDDYHSKSRDNFLSREENKYIDSTIVYRKTLEAKHWDKIRSFFPLDNSRKLKTDTPIFPEYPYFTGRQMMLALSFHRFFALEIENPENVESGKPGYLVFDPASYSLEGHEIWKVHKKYLIEAGSIKNFNIKTALRILFTNKENSEYVIHNLDSKEKVNEVPALEESDESNFELKRSTFDTNFKKYETFCHNAANVMFQRISPEDTDMINAPFNLYYYSSKEELINKTRMLFSPLTYDQARVKVKFTSEFLPKAVDSNVIKNPIHGPNLGDIIYAIAQIGTEAKYVGGSLSYSELDTVKYFSVQNSGIFGKYKNLKTESGTSDHLSQIAKEEYEWQRGKLEVINLDATKLSDFATKDIILTPTSSASFSDELKSRLKNFSNTKKRVNVFVRLDDGKSTLRRFTLDATPVKNNEGYDALKLSLPDNTQDLDSDIVSLLTKFESSSTTTDVFFLIPIQRTAGNLPLLTGDTETEPPKLQFNCRGTYDCLVSFLKSRTPIGFERKDRVTDAGDVVTSIVRSHQCVSTTVRGLKKLMGFSHK